MLVRVVKMVKMELSFVSLTSTFIHHIKELKPLLLQILQLFERFFRSHLALEFVQSHWELRRSMQMKESLYQVNKKNNCSTTFN